MMKYPPLALASLMLTGFFSPTGTRAEPSAALVGALAASSPSIWHQPNLRADSLGIYKGTMDTEMLGKGDIVGGIFEFSPLPLISIQLRAGYADAFEKLDFAATGLETLYEFYPTAAAVMTEKGMDETLMVDDFCVIPLEIGLVGRVPFAGIFGVYLGGGWGYYVIPAFDIASEGGFSASEDIDDIAGYWGLVGVEAGLPNLCVFAEAKYTHIVEEDYEIDIEYHGYEGTVTADIDLSGMTLLAGLRLKW